MEELLKLLQLQKATQTGQTAQPTQGLLGNTNALIGLGLLAQGAGGKGLFEAGLPSVLQAAQIRKLVAPTGQKTKEAYDPKTKQIVFATEQQIQQKGLLPKPDKDAEKEIKDLAKDYRGLYTKDQIVKNFNEGQTQLNKLLSGISQKSAAGDLSAIFTYMKVLDPTSVVREGEQATASNATGVPGQVRNIYNRILSGEKLNDEQRNDFKKTAIGLFQSNQQAVDSFRTGMQTSFSSKGVKPEDVFIDTDLRPKKISIQGKETVVPLGTKLIDFRDNKYIYRMPDGTVFAIRRKG